MKTILTFLTALLFFADLALIICMQIRWTTRLFHPFLELSINIVPCSMMEEL